MRSSRHGNAVGTVGTMLTVLSFDDPLPSHPKRILIAGVSGSGKTSLARAIAPLAQVPHTEIDALHHGPGLAPRDEFLDDVRRLAGQDAWITEWQYATARPILAARADLVVWLDMPFLTVTLPRVVRRTVRRRLTGEVLWNGNDEPPLHTFFTSRDHIVWWSVRTRNRFAPRIAELEAEHPALPV